MLLTGSGEVLTSARAPALPAWAMNAPPPPARKAATCHTGSPGSTIASASSAPPSGRIALLMPSHRLSMKAILSAKNSNAAAAPEITSTQGLASTSSAASWSGSAIQPSRIAQPVTKVTR